MRKTLAFAAGIVACLFGALSARAEHVRVVEAHWESFEEIHLTVQFPDGNSSYELCILDSELWGDDLAPPTCINVFSPYRTRKTFAFRLSVPVYNATQIFWWHAYWDPRGTCALPAPFIFANGFESGDTRYWNPGRTAPDPGWNWTDLRPCLRGAR